MNKTFLTYKQSQKWAKDNNIQNFTQWRTTKRPSNISSNPNITFKEQWKGWPAFLGTTINWMSFNEARNFIKTKNLNGYMEFKEWAKTNDRPRNFPTNPYVNYHKYWKGYLDFLGNTPLPYLTIKRIVKNYPVVNNDDWTKQGLQRLGIKRKRNMPLSCFRGVENFKLFSNNVPLEYDKVKDILKRNKIKTAIQYRFYVRDTRKTNPSIGKQLRIKLDSYPQWNGWKRFKRANQISS